MRKPAPKCTCARTCQALDHITLTGYVRSPVCSELNKSRLGHLRLAMYGYQVALPASSAPDPWAGLQDSQSDEHILPGLQDLLEGTSPGTRSRHQLQFTALILESARAIGPSCPSLHRRPWFTPSIRPIPRKLGAGPRFMVPLLRHFVCLHFRTAWWGASKDPPPARDGKIAKFGRNCGLYAGVAPPLGTSTALQDYPGLELPLLPPGYGLAAYESRNYVPTSSALPNLPSLEVLSAEDEARSTGFALAPEHGFHEDRKQESGELDDGHQSSPDGTSLPPPAFTASPYRCNEIHHIGTSGLGSCPVFLAVFARLNGKLCAGSSCSKGKQASKADDKSTVTQLDKKALAKLRYRWGHR